MVRSPLTTQLPFPEENLTIKPSLSSPRAVIYQRLGFQGRGAPFSGSPHKPDPYLCNIFYIPEEFLIWEVARTRNYISYHRNT